MGDRKKIKSLRKLIDVSKPKLPNMVDGQPHHPKNCYFRRHGKKCPLCDTSIKPV